MSRYHPYKNNKSYGEKECECDPNGKKDQEAEIIPLDNGHHYLHNYHKRVVFGQKFTSFVTLSSDRIYICPGEISLSSYFTDFFVSKLKSCMVDGLFSSIKIKRKPIRIGDIIILSDQVNGTTPTEVSSFVQQGKIICVPMTVEAGVRAPGVMLYDSGVMTHPVASLQAGGQHQNRLGLMPMGQDTDFDHVEVKEFMNHPHPLWTSCMSHNLAQEGSDFTADYQIGGSGLPRGYYLFPTRLLGTNIPDIAYASNQEVTTPTVPIKANAYQQEKYLKDYPWKYLGGGVEYEISGEREYHLINQMEPLVNIFTNNQVVNKYKDSTSTEVKQTIPYFIPWQHPMASTKKVFEDQNTIDPHKRAIAERPHGGVHFFSMLPIRTSEGNIMKMRASATIYEEIIVELEGDEAAFGDNIEDDKNVSGPTARPMDPKAHFFPPIQVAVSGDASAKTPYINNSAFFLC